METRFNGSTCLATGALLVACGGILLAASFWVSVFCKTQYILRVTNVSKQTLVVIFNVSILLVAAKVVWNITAQTLVSPNLLMWLVEFLIIDNYLRFKVACYWVILLLIGIPFAQHEKIAKQPCIIRRKYFHLLAVLMFVPPLMVYRPSQIAPFLSLAYSVALAVLLYVEAARCFILPAHPICKSISSYFVHYLDSRYVRDNCSYFSFI